MSLFQFGFSRIDRSVNSRELPNVAPEHMPTQEESGLGAIQYESTVNSVAELADPAAAKKRKPRGSYVHYNPKERARIGKYALENGNINTISHFKREFPALKESTVRNFKKAYKTHLDVQRKKSNPVPVTEISSLPRGRPPLLLETDEKLLVFLRGIRARGGVINSTVVRATALALLESDSSHPLSIEVKDLKRSWVQSVYKRMGLVRRMATTSRPPVPKGVYNESRLQYLRDIERAIKTYSIPPELVLNSDQIPSSYVSVGRSTMGSRGAKSVAIKGFTDKRNITLNFVVTLSGEFLPMQIIYAGKTTACHPRGVRFPTGFLISQNVKHWSNEEETLKLIDTVLHPYVVKARAKAGLPENQKALVVWDVFRGQMTDKVKDRLATLDFELVAVPANMTHFFQPLDLTVNGSAKTFLRKKFTEYYAAAVKEQIDGGKQLDDIQVDFDCLQ